MALYRDGSSLAATDSSRLPRAFPGLRFQIPSDEIGPA